MDNKNGHGDRGVRKLLTVLLTARNEKETEVQQTLQALASEMARTMGCIECLVTREVSGKPRFVLFLAFRDRRSLEGAMTSETFHILRGAMDVLSEPADVRVVAAEAAAGFLE